MIDSSLYSCTPDWLDAFTWGIAIVRELGDTVDEIVTSDRDPWIERVTIDNLTPVVDASNHCRQRG